MITTKFIFIFLLFSSSLQVLANLSGSPIYDVKTQQFLGSAVRFCSDKHLAKDRERQAIYITAAHVVEEIEKLSISASPAKLEFLHAPTDLAILSAPIDLGSFVQFCVRSSIFDSRRYSANSFLQAPSTFHLSKQLRQKAKIYLLIDGIDPATRIVFRKEFQTPLVLTTLAGMPGRDLMGPLLQFETKLFPGISGSILSALYNDSTGEFYRGLAHPCGGAVLFCEWRPRVIGMITTVSPSQNIVAALPIWKINEVLEQIGKPQNSNALDREPVPGGVLYKQSQITHLRIPNPSSNSLSLSHLIQASSARGNNGGTSRGNNGGTNSFSEEEYIRRKWFSGILFPEYLDTRWLQLKKPGFFWTENEPFVESLWLANQSRAEGIGEKNGILFRTSEQAGWPEWIRGFSDNGCQALQSNTWRNSLQGEPNRIVTLKFCVDTNVDSQSLTIFEDKTILFKLQFTDQGIGKPIQVAAYDKNNQPMERIGLRTYENDKMRVEIDWSSGIFIKKIDQASPRAQVYETLLIGPVTN